MPFTQYVQEKILDPLGMTRSTLAIHQVRATPDRAIGHSPMPFCLPAEFLLIPSGGVWMTADDLARYLEFHINVVVLDGKRLLRQDLSETTYQPPNPAALDAEYALRMRAGKLAGNMPLPTWRWWLRLQQQQGLMSRTEAGSGSAVQRG